MFLRGIAAALAAVLGCVAPSALAGDIRIVARDTEVETDTARSSVRTIEIHDVTSRGEHTRLRVETIDAPVAVAVLFAGGKGAMRLSAKGKIGWGNGNFLIRSRPLFHAKGFITAIIDAPTDRK